MTTKTLIAKKHTGSALWYIESLITGQLLNVVLNV